MSDHTVIAILVVVLALLAGGLGYGLGEQRRHRDETDTYVHTLEEHERRLRAHGALIDVIAEDYDPVNGNEPTPEQRRAAFKLIRGGGASGVILLLAGVLAWLRKHWRELATAVAASGVTAVIAVAVLARGAPPTPPHAGRSPSPPGVTQTAFTTAPSPTTKPGRTPRRVAPPPPVIATRRKPSSPAAGKSRPAPPPPRPSPSRSPTPPHTPTPSPSPTCPVGVAVHLPGAGITICI